MHVNSTLPIQNSVVVVSLYFYHYAVDGRAAASEKIDLWETGERICFVVNSLGWWVI